MAELSKPDARDHMSLPPAAIDWSAGPLEPKGLKIGLLSRCGLGPAGRCRDQARGRGGGEAVRAGRRHVEPVAPFLSPEMLHLQDLFWRVRSWVDFSALSHARQASVLPFIADWCRGGADVSGAMVIKAGQQLHGDPRRGDAGDAAVRLRAVAGLAGADLSRRVGDADQRRAIARSSTSPSPCPTI